METQFGFKKMNIATFKNWINQQSIGRTVLKIQIHHTFIPSYAQFTGTNHFQMQRSMQNHHVHTNGWRDIGQHFSIFPDGEVLTGRSLEFSPACIFQNNQNCICIENVGFFDAGKDDMRPEQKEAIVWVTAALCKKFNLVVDTNSIIYHHWFRLDNGVRNNGAGGNKSCPGTNFFGGNKVSDCEQNFIPLIKEKLGIADDHQDEAAAIHPIKYGIVTAQRLNIRTGPSASNSLTPDREPLRLGSVVRIYKEKNLWLKISNSKAHWVFSRYVDDVERYTVTANTLNVRSGPSVQFQRVGQIHQNEPVFVSEKQGNWAKIAMDNRWVSQSFLEPYA